MLSSSNACFPLLSGTFREQEEERDEAREKEAVRSLHQRDKRGRGNMCERREGEKHAKEKHTRYKREGDREREREVVRSTWR